MFTGGTIWVLTHGHIVPAEHSGQGAEKPTHRLEGRHLASSKAGKPTLLVPVLVDTGETGGKPHRFRGLPTFPKVGTNSAKRFGLLSSPSNHGSQSERVATN